jgi:hypothetical protein
LAALRPFAGLWQSVEFASIAVSDISGRDRSGELISLATNVVFKPEPITAIKVLRNLHLSGLSTRFVAVRVEYPLLVALNEMQPLKTLVANGHFTLDLSEDLYTVRLFGTPGSLAGEQPGFSWTKVLDVPRIESRNRFGIDRHCIALLNTIDPSHIADLILPRNLLNEITAKLSGPPFLIDGVDDLVSQLMPGVHLSMDTSPPTRVIAPLPFDLAFYPETGLRLQAPQLAFEHDLEVSVFFQPSGPPDAYRVGVQDTTEIDQTGGREWRHNITWPEGSETGKAILLYQQKQIDELRFSHSSTQAVPDAASRALAISRRRGEDFKGLWANALIGKKYDLWARVGKAKSAWSAVPDECKNAPKALEIYRSPIRGRRSWLQRTGTGHARSPRLFGNMPALKPRPSLQQ